MEKEDLYITLGCFGRRDNDFISCGKVENRILKITPSLYKYNELMDYLDKCRLFDRPIFDTNAIKHFIFNLYDKFDQPLKRLWSEKHSELYQKFIIDHRHCGLYIKLILAYPQIIIKEEEEPIFILKTESIEEEIKPSLKMIRGR